MTTNATSAADETLKRVGEFRRQFLRNALQIGRGQGFALTGDPRSPGGADLLATGLLLPVAMPELVRQEWERILTWLLDQQSADGAFEAPSGAPYSTTAATAAVFTALSDCFRRGEANAWIDTAHARAGGWLMSQVRTDFPRPDTTPSELGLIGMSLALWAGLNAERSAVSTSWNVAASLEDRLARERSSRARLWIARALLEMFHQFGYRPHLDRLHSLVAELARTMDATGIVAAETDTPNGPRTDFVTQALFTTLACQIGDQKLAVAGIGAVTRGLAAERVIKPRAVSVENLGCTDPAECSDICAAHFVHEAIFRFCQVSTGAMQIPLWTRHGMEQSGFAEDRSSSSGERRPRISFMTLEDPRHACPYLRVHGPMNTLRGSGAADYAVGSEITRRYVILSSDTLRQSDVVIHQRFFAGRLFSQSALPVLERSGAAIIYDLDDQLFELPEEHPLAGEMDEELPKLRAAIEHADLVTTPSPQLAAYLERLGARSVRVIPNAIDPGDWPAADPAEGEQGWREAERPLVFACTGTKTHCEDQRVIVSAVREILARHPDRVSFHFWGSVPPELESVRGVTVDPDYMYDYPTYTRKLCAMGIDLALVPLVDNAFNRAKSSIKWLEFSAAGVPGIYSRLSPYSSVVRDGEDGFLAGSDPNEWIRLMETLIADAGRRRRVASAAWKRVREAHTMGHVAELWESAIAYAREARRHRTSREAEARRDRAVPPSRNPIIIPPSELLDAGSDAHAKEPTETGAAA